MKPDLDAIRARVRDIKGEEFDVQIDDLGFFEPVYHSCVVSLLIEDIPALLAEIERLKAKLALAQHDLEAGIGPLDF